MSDLPIVCNFENGHILTMVMLDTGLTMDEVADAVAEHFAGRMLPLRPESTMRVRLQDGETIPRDMTVDDAGWVALDTIEIFYE